MTDLTYEDIQGGIIKLREDGFMPDILYVGEDVLSGFLNDENMVSVDERKYDGRRFNGGHIGEVAGVEVRKDKWLPDATAVLVDSSSRVPEARLQILPKDD